MRWYCKLLNDVSHLFVVLCFYTGFPMVSPGFPHGFSISSMGTRRLQVLEVLGASRTEIQWEGPWWTMVDIYIYMCVCVHVVFNCEILRVFMSWQGLFVRDENNIIHHDTRSQRTCRHWWCGHTRSAGVRRLFCCLCVSECAAAPDRISQSFNLSHSQGSVNKMPGLLPRMFLCHLLSEIV